MNATTDQATGAKLERRPLASRRWRLSIALAGWLARRSVTPNAISLVGLGAGSSGVSRSG